VTQRLAQRLDRDPTYHELGKELKMSPERVLETLQAFQEPVSLDVPALDGEVSLGELLPEHRTPLPDTEVSCKHTAKHLARILEVLTPREQQVVRLRFGVEQDEPWTLEQVGRSMSVTRERIRQIEVVALKKLREPRVKAMFEELR
jgi:RNA polymerase primary sigma factor